MTSEVVAVVGATGKSGSRVLAKLGEMGLEARGLSWAAQAFAPPQRSEDGAHGEQAAFGRGEGLG